MDMGYVTPGSFEIYRTLVLICHFKGSQEPGTGWRLTMNGIRKVPSYSRYMTAIFLILKATNCHSIATNWVMWYLYIYTYIYMFLFFFTKFTPFVAECYTSNPENGGMQFMAATRDVHRLKKTPQSWGWFFARYSNVNFDISQREKKQKSFIEIRRTEKLFLFKSWVFFCWTWIPTYWLTFISQLFWVPSNLAPGMRMTRWRIIAWYAS